jgi:hypothetical protein
MKDEAMRGPRFLMRRKGFRPTSAFALAALALAVLCTASSNGEAQQTSLLRDLAAGARFGALSAEVDPKEALAERRRLDTALAALLPERPGTVDAYVLTAALWDDPVFEKEALGAAEVLGARFAAEGRSIALSNGRGPGTPRTLPSAAPSEINAAFGRLGELMNPDEDVLVVFLTSHGNPDGGMAIQARDRLQSTLRPAHLRALLDATGVKRRLVIVSSCYSGAFLPVLDGRQTIVMTAAAYDRTSFGCQPSRDWTYFGDAFINRALRGGAPLIAAFDQARETITAWERAENLRPSYPSRIVGEDVEAILTAAR